MTAKTDAWPAVSLIPLQHAVLCADCEVISEGTNGHCAACGSQATISLCKVMGGTVAVPERASVRRAECEQAEAVAVKRLAPQVAC
jgi:hypothetical protein